MSVAYAWLTACDVLTIARTIFGFAKAEGGRAIASDKFSPDVKKCLRIITYLTVCRTEVIL
jgi:hypothetical protein